MEGLDIKAPYLLFLGHASNIYLAKTAAGVRQWRPDRCLAQWRLEGCKVDLGLPDMLPEEAVHNGARTLIIGIANEGGVIDESWVPLIVNALDAGLDIAAGLHQKLESIPAVATTARRNGRQLHNVRHSGRKFSVGTGVKRSGRRLLTVGTDCAVGKKYTALAIERGLQNQGVEAEFRATGQTGVLISGKGVVVDTVTADFIAGAAEWLSPESHPGHWDVVEGQGSLFHPAYSGVTLGLLHGTQPDVIVLCHDPGRTHIHGRPDLPFRPLSNYIKLYLELGRITNPAVRLGGISAITSHLPEDEAIELLAMISAETRVPCSDPVRFGVQPIVDSILSHEDSRMVDFL